MTNTQTNESSVPAESDGGIEALWRDNPLSDIFISYAREDLERAKRLAEALEAQGLSVFWDRYIPPGKTWREVITKALHEARCVVVAWSRASIASGWVHEEAEEGHERKILVPVFFEEVRPPMGFRGIQAASLVNWDGRPTAEEFQQLVSAVADIIGSPKQPAEPRSPPQVKGRKGQRLTLWIAGLALGVVRRVGGCPNVGARINATGQTGRGDTRGDAGGGAARTATREGGNGAEAGVRIPRPLAMGRYEITFDEYDVFARLTGGALPADQGWGRGRRPVINVSWKEAVAYAEWLSQQTGKRYRLPTEAEWEYAARAGTETTYWWGNEVGKNRANCDSCGSSWDGKQTAPVGSFESNPWGLHDTVGNVWEWVQDCYHDSYEGAPADGSVWEKEGCTLRVIRGGSWSHFPWHVRSATRYGFEPVYRNYFLGFRLAQDLD